MTSSSRPVIRLLAGVALLGVATASAQQGPRRVSVELMVTEASQAEGPIDPRARRLDKHLRKDFKYGSLKVLEARRMELEIDEVGSLKLPNGRWVRVRPLDLGKSGVLMAVDVEGAVKSDLRIRNKQLVVIGAERQGESKLVISLEPHF